MGVLRHLHVRSHEHSRNDGPPDARRLGESVSFRFPARPRSIEIASLNLLQAPGAKTATPGLATAKKAVLLGNAVADLVGLAARDLANVSGRPLVPHPVVVGACATVIGRATAGRDSVFLAATMELIGTEITWYSVPP